MANDEYKPVRGDIVQWVDAGGEGEIGIVIGWSGKDTLFVKDIQSNIIFSGPFESAFIVLLRKDKYNDIVKALPRTINLTDTEP